MEAAEPGIAPALGAPDDDEDDEPPSASSDPVFGTETMAELCVRQGRVREALGIYRGLLAGPADDARRERWRQRMAALENPGAGKAADAVGASRPGVAPARASDASSDASSVQRPSSGLARATALISGTGRTNGGRPPGHRLPIVVREPVRSGQVVFAERNDLIVLGPVNPGAQLIADGNIHVYGRLRGRAVAGAHGATDARIYCQRLEAELIGVDIAYLLADDIPPARFGSAAQVFFKDGRCVVDPL